MKTNVQIQCVDQTLIVMNEPVIACGGVGTDTVTFEFCQMWNEYIRSAVFYTEEEPDLIYEVPLVNDSCVIPWEVLTCEGILRIGARGAHPTTNEIKTSVALKYRIKKGAPEGIAPATPSETVYLYFVHTVEDIKNRVETFTEDISKQQSDFETLMIRKQSEYETATNQSNENFKTSMSQQQSNFETSMNQGNANFETLMTNKQSEFESDISKQQSDFEAELIQKQTDFETTICDHLTHELWTFTDQNGNTENRLVYIGELSNEDWVFTLENDSTVTKGVKIG